MTITQFNIRMPWDDPSIKGPVSSSTFHFDMGAATLDQTAGEDLAALLFPIYNVALDTYLSSALTGEWVWSAIDLSAAPPTPPAKRVPYARGTDTINPGPNSLPGEVAVNFQYRFASNPGEKRQRGISRVQFGPLSQNAVNSTGHLDSTMLTDLVAAFNTMGTNALAAGTPLQAGSLAFRFGNATSNLTTNEAGTVRKRQFGATQVLRTP